MILKKGIKRLVFLFFSVSSCLRGEQYSIISPQRSSAKRLLFIYISLTLCFLTGCAHNPHRAMVTKKYEKSLPHIILITIDTLRADHLGCYQYAGIKTPNIDALAGEGTLFEHAYTSTPITLPSHASIMTGLYPQAHGVHNNATYYLNSSAITLSEILQKAGYRTAAFVGAYVLHSRYGLNQGFDLYNDNLPQGKQGIESLYNLYDERTAEETTALALDWLAQNKDAPCFVWLHYFEPHAPYLPPPALAREYVDQPYDGEIASVDTSMGNLLKGVREMGMYDQTAFIVTSDHGEGLGEHDEMTHGVFLYDSTLHIPLIMRFPGIPSGGAKVQELCRTIDIFPTILDYCGLSCQKPIQGESLLPLLLHEKQDRNRELIMESWYAKENFGWAHLEGIRTREWKYIKAPHSELYDCANDPKETLNIWGKQPATGNQLKNRWENLCAAIEKQKQFDPKTAELTPQLREQMKSLGYVWFPAQGESKIDPKEMAPLLDKLDKGVIYYTMGKYEEAISELTKLIELNPENSMGHFHLGCAHFLKGDLHQAKDYFIRVTQLDERQVDAYNYLGYIYTELTDFKQAEEVYKKALKINPHYGDAHYNLGIISYRQGNFQNSLDEFRHAVRSNPHHLEGLYNLGSLYLDMDQLEEAERNLQQALRIDPNHSQTLNSLGKLFNKQKNYEKAEEFFHAAIQADASFKEALNNLASVYIHQAQYSDALSALEKAVTIDPSFGEGYFNCGVVYRSLGQFTVALTYLKKAEESGFSGYELCYAMGDSLVRLGHYKQAQDWLRRAVMINPDSWKAHFDLGMTLSIDASTTQQAIEEYEKSIALKPDMAAPYINLGIIYFQRGNLQTASQLWQQALRIEPDNIEAQINLGGAFVQMGLYDLAVERYQKSLLQQQDNLTIYYNMAIAYLHQQKFKQAIVTLRQALKIDPDFNAGKELLHIAESQEGK
ncbi:MAG: tetratricopeptide repeat protein [bacterium]